ELAERRRQLRQDPLAAVEQRHADVLPRHVRIESGALFEQVRDLPGDLDAAKTPADHDDGQELPPPVRVRLDLGFLQQADQVVAEDEGVAHGLKRPAVGGHAGDDVELDDVAAGEHEVGVRLRRRLVGRGAVMDAPAGQVDRGDGGGAAGDAADHLPDRLDDVHRVDRRPDDVAQQRREDEVVFLAEQDDVVTLGGAALEVLGGVDAGEAAAEDDDRVGRCGHGGTSGRGWGAGVPTVPPGAGRGNENGRRVWYSGWGLHPRSDR